MPYSRTTWVDYPATTTPITAASLNNIEAGIVAAEGIYTNEAARDAAITSPTEGMRGYLTSPTVPAATGAITTVPSGVQTIYNGSAWVCVTEVGAFSTTTGTTSNTAYTTTLTGDGTPLSVTLNTGTTAVLTFGASVTTGATDRAFISVSVSGATTIAASDFISVQNGVSSTIACPNHSIIMTGLTAGANTFTLNYKCLAGATNTFARRNLIVKGIA